VRSTSTTRLRSRWDGPAAIAFTDGRLGQLWTEWPAAGAFIWKPRMFGSLWRRMGVLEHSRKRTLARQWRLQPGQDVADRSGERGKTVPIRISRRACQQPSLPVWVANTQNSREGPSRMWASAGGLPPRARFVSRRCRSFREDLKSDDANAHTGRAQAMAGHADFRPCVPVSEHLASYFKHFWAAGDESRRRSDPPRNRHVAGGPSSEPPTQLSTGRYVDLKRPRSAQPIISNAVLGEKIPRRVGDMLDNSSVPRPSISPLSAWIARSTQYGAGDRGSVCAREESVGQGYNNQLSLSDRLSGDSGLRSRHLLRAVGRGIII